MSKIDSALPIVDGKSASNTSTNANSYLSKLKELRHRSYKNSITLIGGQLLIFPC
jgi:hypothetical protein